MTLRALVVSVCVKGRNMFHDKRHIIQHAHTHLHTRTLVVVKSFKVQQNRYQSKPSFLPEVNGIAKGCISKAIFDIEGGPFTQQILHHFQMPLTCGDMKGSSAIIIRHAQVSAL